MFSVCRSFMRTRSVASTITSRSQRKLAFTTQVSNQDVVQAAPGLRESTHLSRLSISSSTSMEELQTVIAPHLDSMRFHHLIECMRHSATIAKNHGPGFSAKDDPTFKMLAGKVLTKLRFLNTQHCVSLAISAGMLKLDCSSSLVQGIYQMIRKQLNELDIEQIMILQRSLNSLEGSSELTDALKVSLPMVFEAQVGRQLDKTNKDMCLRTLRFVASNNMKIETVNFVARAARKFLLEDGPQTAEQIVCSSAFKEMGPEFLSSRAMRYVLHDCFAIIAENLEQFHSKAIRRIIAAYAKIELWDKALHEALWTLAPKLDFGEIMGLVSLSMSKGTIGPKDVYTLGSILVLRREEFVDRAFHSDVIDCAHMIAQQAAALPATASRFQNVGTVLAQGLERHACITEDPSLLVRVLLDLAILGVYPEKELEKVFSEESQKAFAAVSLPDLLRLFDLERLLRLHFGESCTYVVMPELREKAAEMRTPTPLVEGLAQSMRDVLGGPEFVLEHVVSPRLGVEVDLAAVIRDGKYPVALDNKQSPLEDLPENCKVIAILQCFENRDLDKKTGKVKVPFALKGRFLQAENIFPISITTRKWKLLAPNERVNLIRKELAELSCHIETQCE